MYRNCIILPTKALIWNFPACLNPPAGNSSVPCSRLLRSASSATVRQEQICPHWIRHQGRKPPRVRNFPSTRPQAAAVVFKVVRRSHGQDCVLCLFRHPGDPMPWDAVVLRRVQAADSPYAPRRGGHIPSG
jgi:hypothetical protein